MSGPLPTSADPIIYGLSSPSGAEEPPHIRYETTDKDGIMKVTAVLSRRIHCLKIHSEAIKQSAAFPGQIVEVGGKSYGAGWVPGSVAIVPNGEAAIVQIEARREGVTPFEWGLPPRLSMEMADGVATLFYTRADGVKVQQLQWDSRTGEDRYGWRVEYVPAGLIPTSANSNNWHSAIQAFSVAIYYEGVKQFQYNYDAGTYEAKSFARANKVMTSPASYASAALAAAAGTEALVAFLAALEAQKNKTLTNWGWQQAQLVEVFATEATIGTPLTQNGPDAGKYAYQLTVPVLTAVYDYESVSEQHDRGVVWESVIDVDEASATHIHVFYRLRYANVVFFSIDVTATEEMTP